MPRAEPTGHSWIAFGSTPRVAAAPGGAVQALRAAGDLFVGQDAEIASDLSITALGTVPGAAPIGTVVGGRLTNYTCCDQLSDTGIQAARSGQLVLIAIFGLVVRGTTPVDAVKTVIAPTPTLLSVSNLLTPYRPLTGEFNIISRAYPVGDIRRYGAQVDDVTDDTAAVLEAKLNARVLDIPVDFPPGRCRMTSPYLIQSGDKMRGVLPDQSVLDFQGCDGIKRDPTAVKVDYFELSKLGIEVGTNAGTSTHIGLDLTACQYAHISRPLVKFGATAIRLGRDFASDPCFFNVVEYALMQYCAMGMQFDDSAGFSPNDNTIIRPHVEDVGVWLNSTGYQIAGYGNVLFKPYAGSMTVRAFLFNMVTGHCILNQPYIEGNPAFGIDAPAGFQQRRGNTIIIPHFDGTPGTLIRDPNSEFNIQYDNYISIGKASFGDNLAPVGCVPGVPTVIHTNPNATRGSSRVLITGVSPVGDAFSDDVHYCAAGRNVLSQLAVSGAPAARTYTVSGANLLLNIAGVDTQTVRVAAIDTAP